MAEVHSLGLVHIFIANMDIAVLQSVSIGLAVHLPTHNIIPACKSFHSVKLNMSETLSMQVWIYQPSSNCIVATEAIITESKTGYVC